MAADVLKEVRKAKSEARRPMRAPVRRVIVHDTAERLAALELGDGDLLQAGAIERIEPVESEEFAVEVELGPEQPRIGADAVSAGELARAGGARARRVAGGSAWRWCEGSSRTASQSSPQCR